MVDDYAHHPTEVLATLEAARTLNPRRLVAVFQPHLYSRTQHQAREFGAALAHADLPVVTEIYPAREARRGLPGRLRPAGRRGGRRRGRRQAVAWLPDFDSAERFLRAELREGDLLLTLGAGDIDALGRRLAGPGRTPGG